MLHNDTRKVDCGGDERHLGVRGPALRVTSVTRRVCARARVAVARKRHVELCRLACATLLHTRHINRALGPVADHCQEVLLVLPRIRYYRHSVRGSSTGF